MSSASAELGRGEDAERLLREVVDPGHLARGVDVAAESIERGQQVLAVLQAIERDALAAPCCRVLLVSFRPPTSLNGEWAMPRKPPSPS